MGPPFIVAQCGSGNLFYAQPMSVMFYAKLKAVAEHFRRINVSLLSMIFLLQALVSPDLGFADSPAMTFHTQ